MKLFVYGTLKRGFCRHKAIAEQTFLGPARTASRYLMYNVGSFPGLVHATDGAEIEGELYEVDDALLAVLDRIEGTDMGLFRRKAIELVEPHTNGQVEAYLYLPDVAAAQLCGTNWE